jgi:acyl-coenzyme A synthetase/AMP-(fatty) acid ligase
VIQACEGLDNIVAAVALLDADTQLLYVCCLSTLSCTLDSSQCDKQTQVVREVNDHIRQSGLPAHYLPNKVLIVDNIPMTRHGETTKSYIFIP